MAHQLPPLPYAKDALSPHLSEETLTFHYEKHHQNYVNKLNELIQGTPYEDSPLESLIETTQGAIFNNAAQVYNHNFYWQCLTPNAKEKPQGHLLEAIKQSFGSFEDFKAEFTQTAIATFGSGWAWLVKNPDKHLSIISTSNADTPLTHQQLPLLTCDVWEHAYYIDYRNARPTYIDAFWKLVNWDFVLERLEADD